MKKLLYFAICALFIVACSHQPKKVSLTSEEMIAVDSACDKGQDTAYIVSLEGTKQALNAELDVVLGHAPKPLLVGRPECGMLNWASDALYDMAVKKNCLPTPDFAVVNIGGMRCEWQAGDITRRNIYELMPFDNALVILTLTGKDILELCDIFASQGGQGVSKQLRMEMKNKKAQNILLNGKPLVEDAIYYVATSDYLSTGADFFTPLTKYIEKNETGYLIRDLYLEYAQLQKTIEAPIDGRMTQL